MNRMLRLVSFGGYLAHWLNQYPWMNPDHSNCVRPLFLSLYAGFGGVGTGMAVYGLVVGPTRWDGPSAWAFTLILGGFTLLLVTGWLTNTVPFVAAKESPPEPTAVRGIAPGESLGGHATGVVGLGDYRARFRHRQAILERRDDGELRLAVRKVSLGAPGPKPPGISAEARLLPGEVTNVRRGSAHLVTQVRPAVCFRWKNGPIVLDFADTETRDRAYSELASLAAQSPASRGRRR
jgi:hypothetical protein